ncbi:RNA-directed DNA polymerase, eukaryota [Tanacetum coccineum]
MSTPLNQLSRRFGSSFDINEASAFNDFISRVGLFDFLLGGRRFTRFEKDGGININGVWCDDPGLIKIAAFEHFSARFKEENNVRPLLSIPKKVDPLGFSDYRPISLIGCVYKVISKILANRLAKVIASVISPNQSAFIAGRQILDGCLIANEIIRMASIEDLKLLLFKFDFKKAFDSVNWNFFLDIMRQMGFSIKWRKWMFACLSSASISVMVNGSPSKKFKLERGLRQGDPSLGLKVNLLKSRIVGVGVSCNELEAVANSLGCSHDFLPFSYLGLPVGKRMKSCGGWSDVINRFRDRLSSWKAKSLSIGGRLTLVKSVLGSLPIHYLSLFKDPLKIINILESIRSRFFWVFKESQKGISWVKWNSILLDFENGGLGVGSLLAKNLGLLGKWKWHFLVEKNARWCTVIKDFYGIDGGFRSPPNSFGMGGIWCDIIMSVSCIGDFDSTFNSSFALKISTGVNTSFWADPWVTNGIILKDCFPRLFALENHKDCKVSDRWKINNGIWGGNWSWRLPPHVRATDDLSSLINLISSLFSLNGEDKWVWNGDALGYFKVKTLSKSVQNLLLKNDAIGTHCLWNSWVLRKVNICVWRASVRIT